jgi:protein SCO1/2
MKLRAAKLIASFSIVCLMALSALAQGGFSGNQPPRPSQPSDGTPKILRDIGIEQKLDEQIPLDIAFRDEEGQTVQLSRYFKDKPVILALVYYQCPLLCHQVLGGLQSGLRPISFTAGQEFEVVAVSFDARETPGMAREKKTAYLAKYNREGASEGWHFLTGDQASIDRLTESVGFKYVFDAETNQFAHAAGVMVATPQGKLARYFYGVEYAPKDLKFGLMEASQNRIGSPVDRVVMYCYHYDPATGKYGLVVMNVMRLAGVLTVLGIVALFFILRRKERSRARIHTEGMA